MSAMNVFRISADLLHAASSCLLIRKLLTTKSCAGISLKTQVIYMVVFATRYFDIFWNFSSIYNWIFKIFYLASTALTIYLIAFRFRPSYQPEKDKLPILIVFVPSYILGLLFAEKMEFFEIVWSGSLWLESVALIPQMYLLMYSDVDIENFTADFVGTLGAYRVLYIINWIYRTIKGKRISWQTWVTGIIQMIVYSQFAYYWLKSKITNKKLELPH